MSHNEIKNKRGPGFIVPMIALGIVVFNIVYSLLYFRYGLDAVLFRNFSDDPAKNVFIWLPFKVLATLLFSSIPFMLYAVTFIILSVCLSMQMMKKGIILDLLYQ